MTTLFTLLIGAMATGCTLVSVVAYFSFSQANRAIKQMDVC